MSLPVLTAAMPVAHFSVSVKYADSQTALNPRGKLHVHVSRTVDLEKYRGCQPGLALK